MYTLAIFILEKIHFLYGIIHGHRLNTSLQFKLCVLSASETTRTPKAELMWFRNGSSAIHALTYSLGIPYRHVFI